MKPELHAAQPGDPTLATLSDTKTTPPAVMPKVATDNNAEPYPTGKTPDGTVFSVPHTSDMVKTLFDPRIRKSLIDIITVLILSSNVLIYYYLSPAWRVPVFILLFAFWRLMYNAGLGWLLNKQSNQRLLVKWAKRSHIFESNSFIRNHLSRKFADQAEVYNVDTIPIEFNTWILYRHFVDLVLMSDFTCYIILAVACSKHLGSSESSTISTVSRWTAGIILVLFNLWVKLDAHRVVKDYAWYWGDFFFLEDVDLTFDGVFEMAPHPMYSIGYAGFYGISLMTGSFTMLLVSVLAHACQFAFLMIVETPHIEKTYGAEDDDEEQATKRRRQKKFIDGTDKENNDSMIPAMVLFKNFNITRTSDLLTVVSCFNYSLLFFVPFFSKSSNFEFKVFLFLSCLFWRFFNSIILGFILNKQSNFKFWTKLYLKYGKSPVEAYHQWQSLQNFTMIMSYISLLVYISYLFNTENLWFNIDNWQIKYVLGIMGISLQIYTSWSSWISLGEFGWFFGDFFLQTSNNDGGNNNELTYSGIYRYLNHPSRLFGNSGIWALALISDSLSIYFLTFLWTIESFFVIQFIEQPHMQKLYGDKIRKEDGVSKTIRLARKSFSSKVGANNVRLELGVSKRVKSFQDSVDKIINEKINDFLNNKDIKNEKISFTIKTSENTENYKNIIRELDDDCPSDDNCEVITTSFSAEYTNDNSEGLHQTIRRRLSQAATSSLIKLDEKISLSTQNLPRLSKLSTKSMENSGNNGLINLDEFRLGINPNSFNKELSNDNETWGKINLGKPIELSWKSSSEGLGTSLAKTSLPTKKDWVGLYKVGENRSKNLTTISSQGKWIGIVPNGYAGEEDNDVDDNAAVVNGSTDPLPEFTSSSMSLMSSNEITKFDGTSGNICFSLDKLPWELGLWEFRYHLGGTHSVLARSEIFEVVAPKIQIQTGDIDKLSVDLMHMINDCFSYENHDNSTDSMLTGLKSPTDRFDILLSPKQTRQRVFHRISKLIKSYLNIELSTHVVEIDENCYALAKRLIKINDILKPFV